jgi:glycosyltransferase involved in cell wall biosynthesis
MMDVEISVIIPALNEEKYIRNALDGLRKQTFRNFETIVVDGGSADRTRELAKASARVILLKKQGAGRARNAGARIAKGSILLFLDADTVPSKNLLRTYKDIMDDSGVVAATGPIYPFEKAGWKYMRGYRLVSIYFVKFSMLLRRPAFVGSNFAVRKSAFEKVHGFKDSMISYEDWELSNRLKRQGKMVFSNNAIVQTSIRRVKKWGMKKYFWFYVTNFLKFHLLKESHKDYSPVR